MKVLFRTNAGPHVGFGHLTRCRALAIALRKKGHVCFVVGPNTCYKRHEDFDIFEKWIPVLDWISSHIDSLNLISIAKPLQVDWVVLDDYRIDDVYQLALKAAGFPKVQFDRLANKPLWADVVINANPGAYEDQYHPVLRNQIRLCY